MQLKNMNIEQRFNMGVSEGPDELNRLEKIRAPLINEYKEWLKTWTDDEVYRWEKVLTIYRGDPNMRVAV